MIDAQRNMDIEAEKGGWGQYDNTGNNFAPVQSTTNSEIIVCVSTKYGKIKVLPVSMVNKMP